MPIFARLTRGQVLSVREREFVEAEQAAYNETAIEDGELHAYDGGWAEMLRRREERAARAAQPAPTAEKPAKATQKPTPAPKPRPSEPERVEP